MEATEETQQQQQQRKPDAGDTVQLPMDTSPYVQYKKDDGLEDYKLRAYGARGHLPVSDVPHGGCGTDAPTIPGTAVPVATQRRHQQGDTAAAAAGTGRVDTATDAINRHGVP
uniref:LEA protein 12 n=1 Tax=Oryza sativa subsp. japonica TaxID=39947 RepID=Q68HV3_ORYSJ|nr:LEA protein 12 [Oryza sativa]